MYLYSDETLEMINLKEVAFAHIKQRESADNRWCICFLVDSSSFEMPFDSEEQCKTAFKEIMQALRNEKYFFTVER